MLAIRLQGGSRLISDRQNGNGFVEHGFEPGFQQVGGPDFNVGRTAAFEAKRYVALFELYADFLDVLAVAAFQTVGYSQNAGKQVNCLFMRRFELAVGGMALRRGRFTVVADNMSNNLDFLRGKSAKLSVKNDVLAVLVMG